MNGDLFHLDGRVAVVTGAARGLGKAAALGLAEFGADVAVIDVLEADLRKTTDQIRSKGVRCESYVCDVSDENQVRRTAQQVERNFGRVDILANIARIRNLYMTAPSYLVVRGLKHWLKYNQWHKWHWWTSHQ